MQSAAQLVSAAFQRLRTGGITPGLWLILVAGTLSPIILDELLNLDIETPRLMSVAFPVTLLVFALILFGFWKLERSVADYQDKSGDPLAWFGWTLLAYLPAIVGAIVMFRIDPDGHFYFESLGIMLVAFTAPLLVHASGRAINEHGFSMNAIWGYWSQYYVTLTLAYLLTVGPLSIAGDIIWQFAQRGYLNIIVGDLLSGVLYLAGSVWSVALTVEAFHRAERTEIEAA